MQRLLADDLRRRDMLDAYGLLEYAEQKLSELPDLEPSQSMWVQLDKLPTKLREGIMEAYPPQDASSIPDRVEQLRSKLREQKEIGSMPAGKKCVVLMEQQLGPEAVLFLECLAEAVHCPYLSIK